MHFFNPVHKMPLVEVIVGEKTAPKVTATISPREKSARHRWSSGRAGVPEPDPGAVLGRCASRRRAGSRTSTRRCTPECRWGRSRCWTTSARRGGQSRRGWRRLFRLTWARNALAAAGRLGRTGRGLLFMKRQARAADPKYATSLAPRGAHPPARIARPAHDQQAAFCLGRDRGDPGSSTWR
jgi:hypothetical protein